MILIEIVIGGPSIRMITILIAIVSVSAIANVTVIMIAFEIG